nr:MAG TPA: hypothetical protein [Bacteriophage sp.]
MVLQLLIKDNGNGLEQMVIKTLLLVLQHCGDLFYQNQVCLAKNVMFKHLQVLQEVLKRLVLL